MPTAARSVRGAGSDEPVRRLRSRRATRRTSSIARSPVNQPSATTHASKSAGSMTSRAYGAIASRPVATATMAAVIQARGAGGRTRQR